MTTRTLLSALFAISAIAASGARAQAITCVQPENCTLKTTSQTATQALSVRITGSSMVKDVPVRFEVKKGSGSVSTEARTNETGEATGQWTPAANGAYPAEIQATSIVGGRTVTQTFTITYTAAPAASVALYPATHSGDHQWWFEKNQLPNPLRVEIRGPTTAAECQAVAVMFRAIGPSATAAPDSVNGTWDSRKSEQCVAESWWRLPEGVGTNAVRATLANGSNVSFLSHARRLPRVMAGIAIDMSPSFTELKTTTRTVQMTRVDPVQNTTITFDTIISTTSQVDTTDAKLSITPTIGVDFPLHPSIQRLRASILTTFKDPERNLLVGISLPQLFWQGVTQEGVGFDIHMMMHMRRVDTLRDPTACSASGKCEVDTVNRFRFGVIGFASAADVLSNLTAVFGLK